MPDPIVEKLLEVAGPMNGMQVVANSNVFKVVSGLACPAALNAAQLLVEMTKAYDFITKNNGRVNLQADDVNRFCTWVETPQGDDFWDKLHNYCNHELRRRERAVAAHELH